MRSAPTVDRRLTPHVEVARLASGPKHVGGSHRSLALAVIIEPPG